MSRQPMSRQPVTEPGPGTDAMADVGACRSCGGPILWARTAADKAMPVDAKSVPGGNITLALTDEAVVAQVHPRGAPPGETTYVSHFATCPQGRHWRRPR